MYCKHGTNVGSPGGADLMCLPCELGEPDPTIRELRSYIENAYMELEEMTLWFEDVAVEYPQFAYKIPEFTSKERQRIGGMRRQLALAERWSQERQADFHELTEYNAREDDDDWLTTMWYAEMRQQREEDDLG